MKERLRIFSPGGGYVFNQIHNIQANVPPENVIAMFDAAYEFALLSRFAFPGHGEIATRGSSSGSK